MANHKSAAKQARRDEVRRQRNRTWRSRMRTEMKRFRSLVESGERDKAQALLPATLGLIDRTARAGVIQVNTASRYKSRLQRALNRGGQA
ncbi:MAG: 30S ribosomal protein S20 [Acidobacteria bacterium]|nr:30S ribosomal protein S20 [Acidobacteriota bacterium]